MRLHHLFFTGLFFVLSSDSPAQDDLIDDLPKERKDAAAKNTQQAKQSKSGQKQPLQLDSNNPPLQPQPNTDLIDDVSPEQKQGASAKQAARKAENAIPDNLADAIATALHNGPTILVAEAKVRQAQAELNEVRLSVVQELTLVFQRWSSNKADLAAQDAAHEKMRKKGYLSKEAPPAYNPKLREAVLEDESRIVYLLGIGIETADHAERSDSSAKAQRSPPGGGGMGMMPGMGGGMMGGGMMPGGMSGMMSGGMSGMMSGGMGNTGGGMMSGTGTGRGSPRTSAAAKPEPALPEKLQKFLQARVDIEFAEQPLSDVLDYLAQAVGGDVNFVGKEKLDVPVTLKLKQVTLESGLQAIADLTNHCFILRDYGILVLNSADTNTYQNMRIPMIGPGLPMRRANP